MSKFSYILLALFVGQIALAQEVIDKVTGVVGKYPILLSDIQAAMAEQEKREQKVDKCKAYEALLFQKLLLSQADRDSIVVGDAEVENELSKRMSYFISQFESEEAMEKFYGKRTNVMKDDFRADVQEQLLAEKMRSKIVGDLKPTPAEVRLFYSTIPEDSLPLIDAEVELQQIVKRPAFSPEAKKEARDRLEEYRQRAMTGKSTMSMLARLYSEDPMSAKEGGLITNVARGTMVPEFEATAFRLKSGEISSVFETTFGYHIIELVQRRGELLDLRHILIMPKMSNQDFFKSKTELDSIYAWIKQGKYTFEEAALKFSDDADTKQNGGLMINHSTASTKFDDETLNQLDRNLVITLTGMNPGDISKPMQFANPTDGKEAWKIVKLKNRIDPHKMNLKDDYSKVAQIAVDERNRKEVKDWIKKRSKNTYIKLEQECTCKFNPEWTISAE